MISVIHLRDSLWVMIVCLIMIILLPFPKLMQGVITTVLSCLPCTLMLCAFGNNVNKWITEKECHEFRAGTLYTQKLTHLYGRATSSSSNCLLCYQPDSKIPCFLAVRMLWFNHDDWMTQHCLQASHHYLEQRWIWRKHHFHMHWASPRWLNKVWSLPAHVANRTLPQWLLSKPQQMN